MPPEWLGAAADGAAAVLGAPLALLALLATALAAPAATRVRVVACVVLFLAGALASLWLPPGLLQAPLAAGLLALLGLAAIAAGWHDAPAVGAGAAALGGLAFGLASGLPLALPAEAAGSLALGALVLAALLALGAATAQRRAGHPVLRFAPRVLGAWIAAVGLLLMALQLWGRPG